MMRLTMKSLLLIWYFIDCYYTAGLLPNIADLQCDVFSVVAVSLCATVQTVPDQSPLSCRADCVCIHGLAAGTCKTEGSNRRCICNNDEGLTEEKLAQRRIDECSSLANVIKNGPFATALCPGNIDVAGVCDGDCRCVHKAHNGSCNAGGYDIDSLHINMCKCFY